MVVKVDKSEEFIRSGRKLISEYGVDAYYYKEKEGKKPEIV